MRLRGAQTALSTVFLIGGVIVLYGMSLAIIGISFLNSAFGFQASNRALALAAGGIRDAEIQLMRDKSFSDVGYCVPAANTPCPSGSALVAVLQNTPTAGKVTVTADATASRRRRKVQAVFSVSTSSGAVVEISSSQLSL